MSKRWKTRKRNAEKREKSAHVIDSFYESVIKALNDMAKSVEKSKTNEQKQEA